MMNAKQRKTFSEALGHIGRGVKKLKWVVDSMENENGSETPEAQKSGAKLPPFLAPLNPEQDWTTGGKFLKVVGPSILDSKNKNRLKLALDFLFANSLRADAYRNQWVRDDSAKRGWKKIPEGDLDKYMAMANSMISDCECITFSYKPYDFAEYFFEVADKDLYWEFQQWLQKQFIEKKEFRRYLIGVHKSLPSLR